MPHLPSPGLSRDRARRGSALLLVIVLLVLMALLGIVYLQIARLDRQATARLETANINVIVEATLSYISEVLFLDIASREGDRVTYFATDAPHFDTGNPAVGVWAPIETFDAPYTNTGVDWPVRLADGAEATSRGGVGDDTWLAATHFRTDGTDALWPQITNIMGTYLMLPDPSYSGSDPAENPFEMPVSFDDVLSRNVNVNITSTDNSLSGLTDISAWTSAAPAKYQRPGVDTTGDGVPDARWQWAPLAALGPYEYVMAVRIVDASSMLNVDTAFLRGVGENANSPADADTYAIFDTTRNNASRFWKPTDLDLGATAIWDDPSMGGMTPAEADPNELGDFIALKHPDAGVGVTSFDDRMSYWRRGVATGFTDVSFTGLSFRDGLSEIELRRGHGANASLPDTQGIESQLPILLHATGVQHNSFMDLVYGTASPGLSYPLSASDLVGSSSYAQVMRRPNFTTLSGVSHLSTASQTFLRSGSTWTAPIDTPVLTRTVDLSLLWTTSAPDRNEAATSLGQMLTARDMPFEADGSLTMIPTDGSLGLTESRQLWAEHLITAYMDYFDRGVPTALDSPFETPLADSRVTNIEIDYTGDALVDGPNPATDTEVYGMEALPFFADLYVQAPYTLTGVVENGGLFDLTWQLYATANDASGETIGYGLEIVNPWSSPVRNLEHVRLVMKGWDSGAGAFATDLPWLGTTAPTLASLTGASTLEPGQGLIIRRHAQSSAGTNGQWFTEFGLSVPAGWIDINLNTADAANNFPKDQDIAIELQVLKQYGTVTPVSDNANWVTYARIGGEHTTGAPTVPQAPEMRVPNQITEVAVDLGAPPPSWGTSPTPGTVGRWLQRTAHARRAGLNPISVRLAADGSENDWGYLLGDADLGNPNRVFLAPSDPDVILNPDPAFTSITDPKDGSATHDVSFTAAWGEPDAATAASRGYGFDDIASRYVTDIARVMWVGPRDDKTYAEVFHEAAVTPWAMDMNDAEDSLRSRMLDLRGDLGASNLPRALALMDRLSTLTVDRDLVNLVPGRININTGVPDLRGFPWLDWDGSATDLSVRDSARAMPWLPAVDGVRRSLYRDLLDFREDGLTADSYYEYENPLNDNFAKAPDGKTRPGPFFASIGELMQLGHNYTAGQPSLVESSALYFATDGVVTHQVDGAPVAFDGGANLMLPLGTDAYFYDHDGDTAYDNSPSPGPAEYPVTPAADDRAEELRLAGMLSNVFTVRSDTFVAYIVIQGYRAGQWNLGPAQSARLVAVFERSANETDPNRSVRLRSLQRIE